MVPSSLCLYVEWLEGTYTYQHISPQLALLQNPKAEVRFDIPSGLIQIKSTKIENHLMSGRRGYQLVPFDSRSEIVDSNQGRNDYKYKIGSGIQILDPHFLDIFNDSLGRTNCNKNL